MVMVELKGLHTVRAKGRTYYYAWRGGPRLHGQPGTPAFIAAYNEAVAEYRQPDSSRFRSIIALYKASDAYKGLADTTRRNWALWLDRIGAHFGDLSVRQFDRTDKIRPVIRRWRSTYAATPRAADYGMQVLSRVLSYAVDPLGRIAANPCEGIAHLYSGSRSEIIWTPEDLTQFRGGKKSSPEVMHAIDLASHTGLRVSDLVRLAWSHVGKDAIVISTGKSRHRRDAIIPLYDDLKALLTSIPKRSPIVLTNGKKHVPWTTSGLNSSFTAAMKSAGMEARDLHFHDLRGTAATNFYLAGLSERVIAEIMGWEEDQVRKIIRRYVGRDAATKAVIQTLNRARRRTGVVKPTVKPSA